MCVYENAYLQHLSLHICKISVIELLMNVNNITYKDVGMGEGDMSDGEAQRYRARLQEMQELSRKRIKAIQKKARKGGSDE